MIEVHSLSVLLIIIGFTNPILCQLPTNCSVYTSCETCAGTVINYTNPYVDPNLHNTSICNWCTIWNPPNTTNPGPACFNPDSCVKRPDGSIMCGGLLIYCNGQYSYEASLCSIDNTIANWEVVLILLGATLIMATIVIISFNMECCPTVLSPPLLPTSDLTEDKRWLGCIKYTESDKSLFCCCMKGSSLIQKNSTLISTSRRTKYFLLFIVCLFLAPIVAIIMFIEGISLPVSFSPLLIIPVSFFALLFGTTTYIVEFDRQTRKIYHTKKYGYPCTYWTTSKTFDFDDVQDFRVLQYGSKSSGSATARMEMVLKNGFEIILVDGDTAQVNRIFWRRRREILEWIRKEDLNFVMDI